MAPRKPATAPCPAPRWSLDDLGAALPQHRLAPLSRSSLWRLREAAARKPHRSVDWRTSHAPACAAKAQALCQRSLQARRFSQPGRRGICAAAKPGRPLLHRRSPTPPVHPGTPAKRAPESLRHGVRAFRAACVVPPGPLGWHLGQTRTRAAGAAPLAHVVHQRPARPRDAGGGDTLTPHWSVDVCRLGAAWCERPGAPQPLECGSPRRAFLSDPPQKPVLHCPPPPGSWLQQGERWVRVLARRFLQRGDDDAAHAFATRWSAYLEVSHTPHAPPSRWTSTGPPFVRATPFRHTRRQPRQGRAWWSPRPTPFERACSPPRPYKRSPTALVANL
jgi:hypothetical protein